nr:hypothetical protein [Agromyces protaetiae]
MRLERADAAAVEAELAVVVVLDDEAARAVRPVGERGAARPRQGDPGRELVRGREEHRVDGRRPGVEQVDAGAVGVERQADELESGSLQDVPVRRVPVRLDRDAVRAEVDERPAHEGEQVAESSGHDDVGRARVHAARAREVLGEPLAEFVDALGGSISQDVRRRPGECPPHGLSPGRSRERRAVGNAAAEVEVEPRRPIRRR